MIDRFVVASIAVLYAFFPLYGTYSAFVPHPPLAPLASRPVAVAILVLMLVANAGVWTGAIRRRTSRPAMRGALAANVGATLLGAVLGFDPVTGVGFSIALAGFAFAHVSLLAYYRDRGVARTVYLALLVSGALAALLAIALVGLKLPPALYADNHGRAIGSFLNPNELADYELAYLGAAAGVALVRRGTRLGTFAAVCAAIGLIALVLTYSRWGLVAGLAGLAFYAVAMRARGAAAAGVAVLLLALGFNAVFASRHHDPQDTGARVVAWRAGLDTWLHFPLTGVGPLAFERLYPVMRAPDAPGENTPVAFDPHDLPLSILAETGTAGFAAFVFLGISYRRALRAALRGASTERRTLAYALTAGIVAVTVHMLLNSVSISFAIFLQFPALALAAATWGFDPDPA